MNDEQLDDVAYYLYQSSRKTTKLLIGVVP